MFSSKTGHGGGPEEGPADPGSPGKRLLSGSSSGVDGGDGVVLAMFTDIYRRAVDIHERQFLQDSKVVTEMQCDLGKCITGLGSMFCPEHWIELCL